MNFLTTSVRSYEGMFGNEARNVVELCLLLPE